MVLPAVVAAGLSGCGGSEDSRSSSSKSSSSSSPATQAAEPGSRPRAGWRRAVAGKPSPGTVPSRVVREDGGAAALVEVRIKGRRSLMIVDTGATQTTLDFRLVRKLGLPRRGATSTITSVGCTSRFQPVGLANWRAGSIDLPPVTARAVRTELYEQSGGRIAGLLGADVLTRFRSLLIDYDDNRVALRGPAPRGGRHFPIEVLRAGGEVILATELTIRGTSLPFAVDTGAGHSTIDPGTARHLGLRRKGRSRRVSAVSCSARIQPTVIDDWRTGRVRLPRTLAYATGSSFNRRSGVAGLLGGDVFSRFGTVYFDFKGETGVLK